MKKRIFIAINLPEKVKNKLVDEQQEFDRSFSYFCGVSPIKWTKKDNLHITLFFVGFLEINDLPEVFNIVERVANSSESFDLRLKELIYAPKGKMPPKMVWSISDKPDELLSLQKKLETALLENPNISFEDENKNFSPHITMGRVIQWQFAKIEPEEVPEINKNIDFGFGVKTIEVMESELKRGGAEYTILKSFNLKD
jgi:2'-5' RNA ligase